jgi:hypothetical protein
MSAAVQMAARKLVCVRQLGSTTESAKNGCSSEDLQKSAASGGATGGGGGIDPPRFAFDRSAVIMSPTLADLALHAGIPGKFRGSCPWWRVKTATLRAKIESWRLLVVRASPPPGLQRRPRQQANMRIFLLRFSKRHTLTQPGYGLDRTTLGERHQEGFHFHRVHRHGHRGVVLIEEMAHVLRRFALEHRAARILCEAPDFLLRLPRLAWLVGGPVRNDGGRVPIRSKAAQLCDTQCCCTHSMVSEADVTLRPAFEKMEESENVTG